MKDFAIKVHMAARNRFIRKTGTKIKSTVPGLTVLVLILILLKGFYGALDVLHHQAQALVVSFIGVEDGLGELIIQTIPLVLAAAFCTFAIARRMLPFDSFASVVAIALIVIAGTTAGGFLNQILNNSKTIHAIDSATGSATPLAITSQLTSAPIDQTAFLAESTTIPNIGIANLSTVKLNANETAALGIEPRLSPVDQLTSIDWLQEPNLDFTDQQVAPLRVLPNTTGAIGLVFQAINQLLGFLVVYQPRLFLASTLGGAWIGWRWHKRLLELENASYAPEQEEEVDEKPTVRRAA